MRFLIPLLFLPLVAFGAATPVDNILHWDGTNYGTAVDYVVGTNVMVTNASLGKGYWFNISTPTTGIYISNAFASFSNGVVVCNGNNYFGSSTNVIWNSLSTPTQFMTWRWQSSFSKCSVGFAMKLTGFGSTSADMNDITFFGQGDFFSMTIKDSLSGQGKVGLETGTYQSGASFAITNNAWYWVTMDFLNGGQSHFKIYDITNNWLLIGTTNGAFTAVNNDRMDIGRHDAHQLFPTGLSIEHGDIIVDIANATFPLLPAAITLPSISSQPSAWTNVAGVQFYLLSTAAGDTPLTYQWQQNTNNLAGPSGTISNYTNALPTVLNSGWYDLIVTNPGGSITSSYVYVSITNPPPTTTSGALTISGSVTLSN